MVTEPNLDVEIVLGDKARALERRAGLPVTGRREEAVKRECGSCGECLIDLRERLVIADVADVSILEEDSERPAEDVIPRERPRRRSAIDAALTHDFRCMTDRPGRALVGKSRSHHRDQSRRQPLAASALRVARFELTRPRSPARRRYHTLGVEVAVALASCPNPARYDRQLAGPVSSCSPTGKSANLDQARQG